MTTQLIRLQDGTLVEAEATGQAQPISGNYAKKVAADFSKVKPLLINICNQLSTAWKEINQDMVVEKAEIEVGLSFEGEGNVYITKATVGANMIVKLILTPPKKR